MKKSIVLALLAITWLVLPVRAVEPGKTSTKEQVTQRKLELTQVKEETREQLRLNRCQSIETKINFRLNQSEQNRDKHYTAFQNIKKHIETFITRADAKKCDVTTLRTQLVTFNGLVEKFSAAFRDWKSSIQGARELRCDKTESKTTTAIQTSATKFNTVRDSAVAVQTYVKNTLKPTLASAIQACKPSPKPSASPEVKGNE